MTVAPEPPAAAAALFGDRLPLACRYADLLASAGVERGLVGPREAPRLWERHLLNSAVVAELIDPGRHVVDVGSGAGLPGIPLALARPDLRVTLVEPMARRVAFLAEVLAELGLGDAVDVRRARAGEPAAGRGYDVAVARALAPLGRLVDWVRPMLRPGGVLLAMKGSSVAAEVAQLAGVTVAVRQVGGDLVDPPATVVVVHAGRRPRLEVS